MKFYSIRASSFKLSSAGTSPRMNLTEKRQIQESLELEKEQQMCNSGKGDEGSSHQRKDSRKNKPRKSSDTSSTTGRFTVEEASTTNAKLDGILVSSKKISNASTSSVTQGTKLYPSVTFADDADIGNSYILTESPSDVCLPDVDNDETPSVSPSVSWPNLILLHTNKLCTTAPIIYVS